MSAAVQFLVQTIPGVSRFFCAMALLLAGAGTVRAQTLTERDAVERALARPDLIEAIGARVDAERGRSIAAGTRPNPQLIYVLEQTYNARGTGEDYLSVAQTLHLGGRYRLNRQAGEARTRAREQQGRSTQLAVATDARSRFYECLYREHRAHALEALLRRIEQALAIVGRREARGDAALYDKRRLEREHSMTVARIEAERAHLAGAKHRLAALIGLGADGLSLSGALLPEAQPAALQVLRASGEGHPDLLALEQERSAAGLDAKAAGRTWVPELRLEGGYKGVGLNSGGRTEGFLAGGYLTLPLWDRGTGPQRAAAAEARELGAQKRLIASQLSGELLGVHAETVQLREAAVQFRESSARVSADLVHIASAGYEGGELGLLELLDAYRGAAEDELSALDLELASRRALIELNRLTGADLP